MWFGAMEGIATFAMVHLAAIARVNLFLGVIQSREDWQGLLARFSESGFHSLRVLANYEVRPRGARGDRDWRSGRVDGRSGRRSRSHCPAPSRQLTTQFRTPDRGARRNARGMTIMIRMSSALVRCLFSAFLALASTASGAHAQTPTFTPFHEDGVYAEGEKVGWTVAARQTVRHGTRHIDTRSSRTTSRQSRAVYSSSLTAAEPSKRSSMNPG